MSAAPNLNETIKIMEEIDRAHDQDTHTRTQTQLIEDIRATYAAQGREVDAATIRAAIAARARQINTIPEPTAAQKVVGWAYLRRRALGVTTAAAVALSLAIGLSVSVVSERQQAARVELVQEFVRTATADAAWITAQRAVWSAQEGELRRRLAPNALGVLDTMAERLAQAAAQAPTSPAESWTPDDTARYARATAAFDQSAHDADRRTLIQWDAQAADSLQFDRWLDQVTPPTDAALAQAWATGLSRRATLIAQAQALEVRALESKLTILPPGNVSLTAGQDLVSSWATPVRARGADLLERQRQAWLSGTEPLAQQLAQELAAAHQFLNTDLTLVPVNKEGVKTGVVRVSNDNPDGENHYIIVQALGPSGAPLTIPVVDEETQNTVMASIFGVRVTPAVYERIKSDKMDNGIVDNDKIIGRKPAGTFDINLTVGGPGGMITEW